MDQKLFEIINKHNTKNRENTKHTGINVVRRKPMFTGQGGTNSLIKPKIQKNSVEINTQPLAPITPQSSSLFSTRVEHKAFTVSLRYTLTHIHIALFIEDIKPKIKINQGFSSI